jgi:hypothetical protein
LKKNSKVHLSDNEILLYLERKTPHQRVAEIENHLAECQECSSALAEIYLLTHREEDVPAVDPKYFEKALSIVKGAPRVKKNSRSPRARPALVFAVSAALVALVIFVFYYSPGPGTVNVMGYRGSSASAELRLYPPDGAIVHAHGTDLTWNRVPAAREYKITISDINGYPVYSGSLSDTNVSLGGIGHFTPGKTYIWEVKAFLPDGRFVKSAVSSFEFSRK